MFLYLDDGPSYNGNTEKVLQVLAEKGVKATFFVTGYGHDATNLTVDPRKHELLRRIYREVLFAHIKTCRKCYIVHYQFITMQPL